MTTYSRPRILRQQKPKSLLTPPAAGTLRRLSEPPLSVALQGGSAGQPCEGDSPNPLLELNTQPGHLSSWLKGLPTATPPSPSCHQQPVPAWHHPLSPAHTTVSGVVRQIQMGNCLAYGPTAICTDREDKAEGEEEQLTLALLPEEAAAEHSLTWAPLMGST